MAPREDQGSNRPAHKKNAFWSNHVLAGAISGGLTRFTVAPLDVLKIRFQVSSPTNPQEKGGSFCYSVCYKLFALCLILKNNLNFIFWHRN